MNDQDIKSENTNMDINKADGKLKEEVLKPDEKDRDIEKPKKKHGWRNFFITIGVIIIIVLLAVAYIGIYDIPLLSSALGANKPKDLGVEISEEAINTGLTKTPWESLDELPVPSSKPLMDVDFAYTGSVATTNDFTSEEFSSFVNNRIQNLGQFEDVQVKFYEGGAELSMKLSKYIDAPIYIKSGITTLPDNTLSFDVEKVKIGKISIPQNYIEQFEEIASEFINEKMSEVDGFSIDKLEFKDNFVDFVGTWPEKIERID